MAPRFRVMAATPAPHERVSLPEDSGCDKAGECRYDVHCVFYASNCRHDDRRGNLMHPSAMAFACSALTADDVRGKTVIEAGAYDVNGSVRPHVESLGPYSYIGTDMRAGPGVDMVLAAEELPLRFAQMGNEGAFGVVISTEMLEHAKDWQAAVRGLVGVMRPGGVLVLTTRSAGFPVHGYPDDHWRFSVEAMGEILRAAGLEVERLEADPYPGHPGVFVKARKPQGWAWPEGLEEAWAAVAVGPPR